eukprot:9490513-Pyramimonas_sp.AAC.1
MLTSHLSKVSEISDSYICACTDASYSTDMHYFISDDFSDNHGSGFESVEGIAAAICGPDDCGERTYHQAKVRLISCSGEKYKDVTSNVDTHNCVNHDACEIKCLNTGQLDGDPVIVPSDQGVNIQCYEPATNNLITMFSYDATPQGTCSSNVCSDTMYRSCSYETIVDNEGWGTREIVTGTDNKNISFTHNPVDGEIFRLGTELSLQGENTIKYDTRTNGQVGCPSPSDYTVPDLKYTKKSVYKYTQTVTQVNNNDVTCVPVPDKTLVKYTIEDDETACPKDCMYYWETDDSGYPIYGDCTSTCRETATSSVTKTQNYLTRGGNSVGNSTCSAPTLDDLVLHSVDCGDIPLCCTPNDGTWGPYMYNGTNYGHDGDCPSCTDDGNLFELTRLTTGRITCNSTTGVADTRTQGEETKKCNPKICGEEVPGTSEYTDCIQELDSEQKQDVIKCTTLQV